MKFLIILLTAIFPLQASVIIINSLGVQRLANGNTLITDAGFPFQLNSKIIEVDSRGSLVWAYINGDLMWAHSAQKLPNGNVLISDTNNDRVIEVDIDGNIVWSYSAGLDYPNDADRLSNGNTLITDRNNDRVIEVDPSGTVVWQYNLLNRPHNADRLDNTNTIISNSENDSIVEVDTLGNIVWCFADGLDWPRDADRLSNGNTLITDTKNSRVIEVTPSGSIVWSYTDLDHPYEADRLSNGNTLIANPRADVYIEVDSLGTVAWQYPQTKQVVVDTVWIYNPASGCTLYVHLHRPSDATPSNRFPGVIIVPGGNGIGGIYDSTGLADRIADDGFILVHFDPDGRGLSTNHGQITTEDYCGYKQQDGLWEIAKYLQTYPYVDVSDIGIFSQSYGVTMASGELSRHKDDPYIKFFLDWEGPSDRYQTCQDSGGHVPIPPDSEEFWIEREAARFMKSTNVLYLRMQTEEDHNPRITDNRHAIALIDSGTAIEHGGKGICPWTRVNDSLMNAPNMVYTINNPPEWIPESQEKFDEVRYLLYLHELSSKTAPEIAEKGNRSRPSSNLHIPTIINCGGVLRLYVAKPKVTSIRVFDPTGRLAQEVHNGHLSAGYHNFPLNIAHQGIYFVIIEEDNSIFRKKIVFIN